MSGVTIALLFLALMLVLMAVRVPIAIAMLLTGIAGYVALAGWSPLLSHLKSAAFARYSNYDLSVVPMFLLMGNLASRGGLSAALFNSGNAFIGHFRGGIAMAAVAACAGFGAICGSSLATAATMGQVALPELRKHKYDPALATGALAAGGTLGILIPPSVVLAVYAILTEQNIAKLFTAAFVPGVIATLGYMLVIAVVVRLKPGSGPAGPRHSWRERGFSLLAVWPVVAIFIVMLGGMYGGYFSATEGAAIGTSATLVLAIARGMRLARTARLLRRDRPRHGHDLPDPARRRRAQLLPRAVADAGRTRDLGAGQRAAAARRPVRDHPGLRLPRLHHGQPVHDPAHHPHLLPDDHGPRSLGPRGHREGHLVRYPRADGGGDRV